MNKPSIFLFYKQATHRGPGKVVQNLTAGLKKLNVNLISQPSSADYIGCLQDPGGLAGHFPSKTLMGPNIFVLPHEQAPLVYNFNNFIVPSQWVKDVYMSFNIMKDKNVYVWPVGIDTDEWSSDNKTKKTFETFIYCKNRPEKDYQAISQHLSDKNINFTSLHYGHYTEESLKDVCGKAKSCILLTDTESQGIAYMQILSMGIPCLVVNKSKWNYQSSLGQHTFNASSTPYFDERCGLILKDIFNFGDIFDMFIDGVNQKIYSPRDYILENHTLVKGAEKYLKILKNIK